MLQRKREALLLLAKDLEQCMRERDQLRSIVKKFVSTCECSAGGLLAAEKDIQLQVSTSETSEDSSSLYSGTNKERDQELRHQKSIIHELLKQKRVLHDEVKRLEDKVSEAHEDIKLLRETVARQRVGSSNGTPRSKFSQNVFFASDDEFTGSRNCSELESLISELEAVKRRNEELEQELFAFTEQNKEQSTEKDYYVGRSERLNVELNHILSGNSEKAIVDIDALALENNHLKSQLAQLKCEKEILQAHYVKLKQVNGSKTKPNPKRSDKSLFQKVSQKTANNSAGQCKFLSTKEVQQYLLRSPGKTFPVNAKTVEELHTLALSLTETIEEKNMSLSHQKNTNKALGFRVSELESKLKALEFPSVRNGANCVSLIHENVMPGSQSEVKQNATANYHNDPTAKSSGSKVNSDYGKTLSEGQSNEDCSAGCNAGDHLEEISRSQLDVGTLEEDTETMDDEASLMAELFGQSSHAQSSNEMCNGTNEVFQKFFSSIDSQLSNDRKMEKQLGEINLNS